MRPVPIGDPHPRMGWLLSEAKLTQLYDRLWLAGKIECTYGSFAAHFIGQPAEKIRWLATIGELVLLISALMDCGAVPYRKQYLALTFLHFAKRDGTDLAHGSLRVLKAKVHNRLIDDFITSVCATITKTDPTG